jgi:integrase
LRVRWKRGWAYAHFTWAEHPFRIALRTRDKEEARTRAAHEYAQVVNGFTRPVRRQSGKLLDLGDVLTLWLESKRTSVDPSFYVTLEGYAAGFNQFFRSLGNIDEATGAEYGQRRLGEALRTTVLRELAYLREFLEWCVQQRALQRAPTIPKLPKKAKGVRTGKQRAKYVHITEAQARAILALLPWRTKTIDGRQWPLRARFAFMWQTMLRPTTIAKLRVPESWRSGSKELVLADEDDKNRWGRTLDLSPEAVDILERWAPKEGLIFGDHNHDKILKRAACAVLGEHLGEQFAPYDFRHGGAKEALDAGAPLRGVSYQLGHTRPTTTDRYTAPDRAAGRLAVRARVSAPKKHPTANRPQGRLRNG